MGKKFKYMIFMSFLFLVLIPGVSAEGTTTGCEILGGANSKTVQLLSWVVKLIRFGIPIIIVIFGMVDFLKILFSGEDKVYKDAFAKFVKRLLIGAIIIFIPYVLHFIVRLSGVDKQYGIDNFFCGIIDATSGVTLEASDYSSSTSCRTNGYYWLADKGECVKGISNISKQRCKDNGYTWEDYQNSQGIVYGGKCSLPSASSIHNMTTCNNLGYDWVISSTSTYGGTCR